MKISTRLAAGFSLLIILFVLCTGIALNALWQARDGMEDTVNNKMKRFTLVQDMRGIARDMAIAVRNLALLSDPVEMQPEWQRLISQQKNYIEKRRELVDSMRINVSSHGKEALEKVVASESAAMETLMIAGQMGLDNRQQEATVYLMKTARPAQQALMGSLDALTNIEMTLSKDTMAENSASTTRTAFILLIMAALSVIISVVTGYLIVRVLMRQLGGEPAEAQALAAA
ncbi:MCP four helix bundle domain-containing protein, partial [Pantoea sp. PNT03]